MGIKVSANDWIGTTPFTCTCARELWLMLMTIRVKSDHSLFTFVVQRYSTLTESTSTRSHPTASFAETKKLKILSKDPLALVWLLVHLSRLGGFNQTGTWDKKFSRVFLLFEFFKTINSCFYFFFFIKNYQNGFYKSKKNLIG